MMDMAKMMEMMRQSGDRMGMDTIDHIEGRVAFLRAELKITEAQQPAWNAFADALRTNAKALGEMRGSMMSQQGAGAGLVEKLAFQEKWLAARLEGTPAMKSALTNLVSTFSDEQKKAADELFAPQMGRMPMMFAMRGGGSMAWECSRQADAMTCRSRTSPGGPVAGVGTRTAAVVLRATMRATAPLSARQTIESGF